MPDDENIIHDVLAGRRNEFARLVSLYQDRIRRLCFSFLRSETDSDEAAQDVFVKAYKALPKFRGESRFSTWLYRIAVRHCQDVLRTRQRLKSQSLESLFESRGGDIRELLDRSPMPESVLEAQDLIRSLLERLHPRSVEILTMREANGFSYEEIAAILNITIDSVKGRLKRARREIQEKFRHLYGAELVKTKESQHDR